MSPLKIGLVGSTGRMGQSVLQILEGDADFGRRFQLVYAVSGPKDSEFPMMDRLKPDVVIDFSAPESTLAAAKLCAQNKVPLLVCTTGFTDAQKTELEKTLKRATWALVPNTSLGVQALQKALAEALKFLPPGFSVSIVESHHQNKKDKPSGTAKALASIVAANSALPAPEIHSLRGGNEIGEHTVILMGPSERLEFKHRALDRALFARGALELAAKLRKAPKRETDGAWSASELLGL